MISSRSLGARRLIPLLVILASFAGATGCADGASHKPPKPTFTISGDVAGLYPGGQRTAAVRITNRYHGAIEVRAVTIRVVSSNKRGCPPGVVRSPGWSGHRRVVGRGTATVKVPVRMSSSSPNACQGATFRLRYDGWGVRP